MSAIPFPAPPADSEAVVALRAEVRAFLAEEMANRTPVMRSYNWCGADKAFSRRMGQRGWLGMTWPKQYGGHERSAYERYVVVEETLAAGAPVGAHWIADRQSGPSLLKFGTAEQKSTLLPRIAAGELSFSIGMSEPDSGSDLAATTASPGPRSGPALPTNPTGRSCSAEPAAPRPIVRPGPASC
jgi:alkylation response protein AidB-like acyl-CoA dehydrogenase